MYAAYKSGKELKEVAEDFNVKYHTLWASFKRDGHALRKQFFLKSRLFNGLKYSRQWDGQWLSTAGGKKTLTHAVWEFHKGKLKKGTHLRFKDGDRDNMDIDNLEIKYIPKK